MNICPEDANISDPLSSLPVVPKFTHLLTLDQSFFSQLFKTESITEVSPWCGHLSCTSVKLLPKPVGM